MIYGYWFWLGVLCIVIILLLLFVTRNKRNHRTLHAVALFALLAFGGFKCAREEHINATIMEQGPFIYTFATITGSKSYKNSQRIEFVEYNYHLGGKNYIGLDKLSRAYTIERDFYKQDVENSCLLIKISADKLNLSNILGILKTCPPPVPAGLSAPDYTNIDKLWLKDTL